MPRPPGRGRGWRLYFVYTVLVFACGLALGFWVGRHESWRFGYAVGRVVEKVR